MSIAIKQQSFVHVVGTIDLQAETGQILYVNPASVGVTGTEVEEDQNATLVVEDASGVELIRMHTAIRRDPCDTERTDGLIQQDVPFLPGMSRIRLLYKGKELATYEAATAIVSPASTAGLSFGMAQPPNPHRRLGDLPEIEEKPGVTYTVMVRAEGQAAWQAVKVGGTRPAFELDANQFPGVSRATVRVLRSSGFEDEIIAEEEVELEVE